MKKNPQRIGTTTRFRAPPPLETTSKPEATVSDGSIFDDPSPAPLLDIVTHFIPFVDVYNFIFFLECSMKSISSPTRSSFIRSFSTNHHD